MNIEGHMKTFGEIYKSLEGEMAATLKAYYEFQETYSRLGDEYNSIGLEYPEHMPTKVEAQYDKLKFDLAYCRDKIGVCEYLMLIGIPLDEFNRVYEQAKLEVLDTFSRYETDAFLNVFMYEHKLSAYLRYCRATKELSYKVEIVYPEGEELPDKRLIDGFYEFTLLKYPEWNTLSELHAKWKENKPDELTINKKYQYVIRSYSTVKEAHKLLEIMVGCLYISGDIPTPIFQLRKRELKKIYKKIVGDDKLS